MLTRDGRIKILDFGLAKMAVVPSAFQPDIRSGFSDTETLPIKTDPGVVMGTAGYMSPEQVKGLAADHRSDIFSFGVILYELLGGRRAFHGDTAIETMRAILKEDPPELPDSVPSVVRQVVIHCLEKEPENRFQSARDLSFALSAMSQSSGGSSPQSGAAKALAGALSGRSSWRKRATIAATALVLLTAGVAGGRILWDTPAAPEWSGEILGGPEMAIDPRLSPDGSLLAFQAFDRGNTQVAVMKPETGNWSILTHSREHGYVTGLAWSADGASIYYDRLTDVPQGVYSIPLLGGDEHLVLENAGSPQPLPDGSLLVTRLNAKRQTQLFRFWPDTGRLQDLPVLTGVSSTIVVVRTDLTGKQAVVFGNLIERESDPPALVVVDLGVGAARPITSRSTKDSPPKAFAFSHDGQSIITSNVADSLTRIASIPINGRTPARTLFTVTNPVWYLDPARGREHISEPHGPVRRAGPALAERRPSRPDCQFSNPTGRHDCGAPGRARRRYRENRRTHPAGAGGKRERFDSADLCRRGNIGADDGRRSA